MLRAFALAALLALPLASAADVSFGLPAQADGGIGVGGAQWALLVFHGASGVFSLDLAAGTATNHTTLRVRGGSGRGADGPGAALLDPRVSVGVRGDLALLPEAWGSLYVEADHLDLGLQGAGAEMGHAVATVPADTYLPWDGPRDAYRAAGHAIASDGAWLALHGPQGAAMPVTLAARGVHRVEWHNATLACAQVGPCPAAARTWQVPGPGAALVLASYAELAVPDGTVGGAGPAVAVALGGPRLDLRVAGSVRLPDASVQGDCGASRCPDPAGRTLLASGNLTLAGLAPHPAAAGRMRATLGGAIAQASLDEAAAPGFSLSPAAAAVAVGALVALPLLLKVLLGLFARSARPPALHHPKRQALYELIRAEPGLSFRAIQRRLEWPHGTLANHMARLLDVRLVVGRPYRNTVRYFENHGRYDATWGEAVLLRDPNLRALHAWLGGHPLASQGDVLGHCAAAGWKRSTTQDRLRALLEGGLVEAVPDGRRTLYRARAGALDPATLTPR